MNILNKFTASLHTHVRSLYDAHIDARSLCERIKEMDGKGCAITDHGTVSAIEDFRPVFKEYGLKLIPGCELYVDGGLLGRQHLVVLAVNDRGWKGISKIVTASNLNLKGDFPVITKENLFEIVKEYKGDIIALSACIQGVIASVFNLNDIVTKKIDANKLKQERLVSFDSNEYKVAFEKLTIAEKDVENTTSERDNLKALAGKKYVQRKKALLKAKEKGSEDADKLLEELNKEMLASEEAKKKLEVVKEKLAAQKKKLSAEKEAFKAIKEMAEKFDNLQNENIAMTKLLKSEDELNQTAIEEASLYLKIFGEGNFFMEIQNHGIKRELETYPKIIKIARKLKIPLVATNDVHILTNNNEDRLRRQILRSLRFGNDFEEEQTGDCELYLKDNEELKKALLDVANEDAVNEAILNIDNIFNRCNVEFSIEKHYPKFCENADERLDIEIQKGIKWRFPNGMDEEHVKRLEYELPIIKNMGYSDYHLIVKDFLEYGRLLGYVPKEKLEEAPLDIDELRVFIKNNSLTNPGFAIGPGRGSAVGSLACYLLGITNLDPLRYNLLFERFLNPERISMPDIDSDISKSTRAKVIEYVKKKYGERAVCGILTHQYQAPKGAIDIAAKYYGLKHYNKALTSLGRQIATTVPEEVGLKFDSIIEGDKSLFDYLNDYYSENADALGILKWAKIIEGSFTAYGAHAAGIVISDNNDISEYIPLKMNEERGMFTTQCDMVQVEDNGLLKFDFLGLRTLDIITDSIKFIEKNTGIVVDPLKLDLNDSRVYKEIFSVGKTNSVFQFESDGMKTMLKRFKPECFEDLIILVSMFRPGPLQYLDDVIQVKNGERKISFLCDQLKPILGKTYGAIVYQEQVMEIFQSLAGYTLGGADQVRRYMSKKKKDKLAHERESFIYGDKERSIKGCVANGIDEKVADELFSQMEEFAKYAFNKSHAAAYAFNAFITAWIKLYYSAEFFAAALNWAPDSKKIAGLVNEATKCNVKILGPDINWSEKEFVAKDGRIRFGLYQVPGVKNHAVDIIKAREEKIFSDFKDFYKRTNPSITVCENLIDAGAFDAFCDNRKSLKALIPSLKKICKSIADKTKAIEEEVNKLNADDEDVVNSANKKLDRAYNALDKYNTEFATLKVEELEENIAERCAREKELLGMYVSKHLLDYYPNAVSMGCVSMKNIQPKVSRIYGVVSNLRIAAQRKDGKNMAFFSLEDKTGSVNVVMFASNYCRFKDLIKEGQVLVLAGETKAEEEGLKFFCKAAKSVSVLPRGVKLSVNSYAVFHAYYEEEFRNTFEQPDGLILFIEDKAMNEIRRCKYKVSRNILRLDTAKSFYKI